jgi:hypothetical protein
VLGIIMLIGGEHGPGRHAPPASEQTPPAGGSEPG